MNLKRFLHAGYRYLTNSDYRFLVNASKGMYDDMPDVAYIKRVFQAKLGYPLNLENPKSFNEKLQWLKLYDRNPLYTKLVDKYAVRQHIANVIGEEYLIEMVGGPWYRFEDIDFDQLPQSFVLKCTHDSGSLVICEDKAKLNVKAARKKIERSLRRNYYLVGRELPYKNVRPRIIAEVYMEENEHGELKDYKLMCFNGKVRCSFVCVGRNSPEGMHVTFFDREWKPMPFKRHYPNAASAIEKPQLYDQMLRLAEKVAENMPFVRVDFYEVAGKIYFGEMTFFPGNGFEEFTPEEWDYTLGSWIQLPQNQCRQ